MSDTKFSKAELKVQAIARHSANNQLMRVPWTDFRKAYEEYPSWQALVLWVQAIVATQDGIPSWLVADVQKRCPGFEHDRSSHEAKLLALHLFEWIHNQKFGYARKQGWLEALTFYGVRHPHSQTAWAYWEHCEDKWNRRPPSSHPKFEEWLHLARSYNPRRGTSVTDFAGVVDRYVEWKIFSCWLEPLTRAKIELPKHIASELERRCPGFLGLNSSNSTGGRCKKVRAGRHLMAWVEDRFFGDAKKEGWLEVIRQQVLTHPLYARMLQYSKRSTKILPQSSAKYPSFARWRRAVENYTED